MFYFRKITILLSLSLIITLPDSLQAAQEKPNIVYNMVDDMGYGDAGCYNPKSKIPTPNIDSLANAGMRSPMLIRRGRCAILRGTDC